MNLIKMFAFWCVGVSLIGCATPTKTLNLLTPDRIGLGRATGTMAMQGKSYGGYDGEWWGDQYGGGGHGGEFGDSWSDVKMDGTSESTMLWLEWDFPQWSDNAIGSKTDKYMRERIRHLNYRMSMMEAEEENDQLVDVWLKSKPYEQ